jgi:hypothetical protein
MDSGRTRALIILCTWVIMTFVGFYLVDGHEPFVAFFGVWGVMLATGLISVLIGVIVRLLRPTPKKPS